MNRYEFYKDLYFKEIERRSQLNNDISIPVGLATVLATAIFYYFTTYSFKQFFIFEIVFTFTLLSGTVTLCISVYFIIQSYTFFGRNMPYDYIAFPKEIEKYYVDYINYETAIGIAPEQIKINADTAFENYLLEAYIRTTSKNTCTNDKRSFNLYMSKKYIIISFISLFIAFIPFAKYLIEKPDKPQKVEVTSINNVIFTKDSNSINFLKINKMADQKPVTPPTQSSPTQPPTPPRDRQINEGEKPQTIKK
jgi:hypothetical protein